MDGTAEETMQADAEVQPRADADAQMRAALANRAAAAKGKRKRKGDRRKGDLRKGRATQPLKVAPKGVLKRPAAKPKGNYTKLTTIPWTNEDKKRSRNTFVSLWYKRQQVLLRNSGSPSHAMKTELSRVLGLAGGVCDKHMK